MTNAEYIQKNGWKFGEIDYEITDGCLYVYKECKLIGKVFDISWEPEYAFITWLDEEYKAPVLDEAEKKYLSAVVKPFKDQVKYIAKRQNGGEKVDRLEIKTKAIKGGYDYMYLPGFEEGTMYKGMKYGKLYTLEELGL